MGTPRDWIEDAGKPALHLTTSRKGGKSQFGGCVTLPAGIEWPHYCDMPLELLAVLDLTEIQTHIPTYWLPTSGFLAFFYDTQKQPWGFDGNERDGWRVIFLPNETTLEQTHPKTKIRKRRALNFTTITTYSDGHPATNRDLEEKETETLIAWVRKLNFGKKPRHQAAGYPEAIHRPDMQAECELASHGIHVGFASAYKSPQARAVLDGGGANDWALLLQLDTDNTMGWMWGDCGTLYFWVKESEASKGNFENAWAVLQCY